MLKDFRIAGDVIDAVIDSTIPNSSERSSVEPPPVGAKPEEIPEEDSFDIAADLSDDFRGDDNDAADPDDTSASLTFERDGLFHVFRVAGTTYRLGGVKSYNFV